MSSSEGFQRGSRSHGGPSQRSSSASRSRSQTSQRASTRPNESRTRPRSSAGSTAARRLATHQSSRSIRPQPSAPSPFQSRLVDLWRALKVFVSGAIPPDLKEGKVTSSAAHQAVHRRLGVSFVILTALLLIAAARVVLVQTTMRGDYLVASLDQRTRISTVRAARGVIFDRHGNELALSIPSSTVFADPRDIEDFPGTARTLAAALGYTPEQEAKLLTALSAPGEKFHYIARQLDEPAAQGILGLGLKGIYSYTEPARQVEGGVAAAIIGRTDPDGVGTSGLEKQFNKNLTGLDGRLQREVSKKGGAIAGSNQTIVAPVPGDDIVLTIDKNIQFQTDSVLMERVGRLNAKGGTAIVMNSRTGEIYAMSNVRRNDSGAVVMATGNFAAVEAYEPGSVAKVFSVSAALNEGTVNADTVMKVPGIVVVDKFPIRDAWPHGVIDMSVRSIVSESSNIGTMMTAQTIKTSTLHDYLSAFGFGRKTGLNYPGESRGILRDADKWRGTEKVTVSYGYGLAVTPLQMIAGVNTVANNGTYIAPKLVSATIDKSGIRREVKGSTTRQVLKPQTAATMQSMLRDVVCTGTGEQAQVKGMEIAGKTGTGYKVQSNGTYQTDAGGRKYFASFAGFFPASSPEVTILVSIDEPDAYSRDRFGGTAAAPVFARLVPAIMHELGIEATGAGTGCKAGATPAGL
jgi:cell division protein FtsI (penicillin-binding protein 3)